MHYYISYLSTSNLVHCFFFCECHIQFSLKFFYFHFALVTDTLIIESPTSIATTMTSEILLPSFTSVLSTCMFYRKNAL